LSTLQSQPASQVARGAASEAEAGDAHDTRGDSTATGDGVDAVAQRERRVFPPSHTRMPRQALADHAAAPHVLDAREGPAAIRPGRRVSESIGGQNLMNSRIKVIAAALGAAVASAACGTAGGGSTSGETSGHVASALGTRQGAVLPRLATTPMTAGSTVPDNGDVNPYGVAFVPPEFPRGGLLRPGDVIVSNFNNGLNRQGTGTTIVRVNPTADAGTTPSLFFEDGDFPGFSTALGVLKRGFVLVGNVPSTDGSGVCTESDAGAEENVGQGALLVIDRHGRLVKKLRSREFLDGPWDLTVDDDFSHARVFVSNVLNGTVARLDLRVEEDDVEVESKTRVASGYLHRCDESAFVVGPTGLAFDEKRDVLYVASTGDNEIFAVHHAGKATSDQGMGEVAVHDDVHLHGPLGLARAKNGDLISAQGDAVNTDPNQLSEIVEFSADGGFVFQFQVDTAGGAAFGLALEQRGDDFQFAAVDDNLNVLDVWKTP
jgi:hypothetical protein